MQKILLTLLLCSHVLLLGAQDFKKRYIYQYEGTDSTHKELVLTRYYDHSMKLVKEEYKGYKNSTTDFPANMVYNYTYKDYLLGNMDIIFANGDTSRTAYHFNRKKELNRQTSFYYGQICRIKDDGSTICDTKHWNENPDITKFEYDNTGMKSKITTKGHPFPAMMVETYNYDDSGRIDTYKKYNMTTTLYKYEYYKGGYKYIKTYDYPESTVADTTINTFDAFGRQWQEKHINHNPANSYQTITNYNNSGYIDKTVRYNSTGNVDITNVYRYE